jgi:hypothetical protein
MSGLGYQAMSAPGRACAIDDGFLLLHAAAGVFS